jgi:hypothetical protein
MSEGFGMNRNHLVGEREMVDAGSSFSTDNHFPRLGKMVVPEDKP